MNDPKNVPRRVTAPSGRLGDLGVRAASGLVLIVFAIATTRIGGDIFILTWLAAALAVLWEWQRLVGGALQRPRLWIGCAVLVFVAVTTRNGAVGGASAFLVVAAALQAGLGGVRARLWAAAGMLYAGLLLMSVIALRFSFPFGTRAIIWLFATVWSTDVFAYFGGRLIGGPKLWPRISPSKTWSGTLTGIGAGAVIGTFAALRDLPPPTAVAPVLIVTLVAALLSQVGDAFESGVKRHFGVKDSSRLIPGHGGMMDRLDGFIAAAVFAFGIGMLRDLSSVASGLFYWA